MKRVIALTAAAALWGGVSSVAMAEMSGMAGAGSGEVEIVMKAGQGLPMDVGGKRIVGYYTKDAGVCGITLVLAESQAGGMANGGTDAPHGIRMTGQILPGKSIRVDGEMNRAAEFKCGKDGLDMTARIFTSEGYKKAAGK